MTRTARGLAACAALLLASCAAPLRFGTEADLLAILEPGLAAYARLDGALARRILPAALPAEEAASLGPLLERTRLAALGVGQAGASGARPLEAALAGDYPFRRASLALAASKAWRREGAAYVHKATGLRALLAGPDLVLASSGPVEPLLARAREPGPSPLPTRLEALAGKELLLWIPDPFPRLGLGEEEGAIVPARGLLVAASPRGDGSYIATVAFLMEDADSARVYRPALRLAWYFLARGLMGEEADPALGARFSLDGELVYAAGVVLPEAALARAVAGALAPAAKK